MLLPPEPKTSPGYIFGLFLFDVGLPFWMEGAIPGAKVATNGTVPPWCHSGATSHHPRTTLVPPCPPFVPPTLVTVLLRPEATDRTARNVATGAALS